MELDFTGLSGIPSATETPQAQGAGKLQRIANQNKSGKEAAEEVYRLHQEATMRAGKLITEIRKGILSGQNVYALLLKAIKTIELTTGESGLAAQAEADIIAIYGCALWEPEPLQMERDNIQRRIDNLTAALKVTDADTAERIRRALREHERKRDEINKRLERG